LNHAKSAKLRGGGVQFLFSDYALDIDRRELRRGAELISVGPQVFDLLVFLVENRERVVSKDDLFEAVWSGRIVSESTLTTHINAVRKAVGDTGDEQSLIRTIPRKGFRFVGEIREEQASKGQNLASVMPASERDESKHAPALSLPDKPSIAVLPFQNLSGDPEQEYFADGMVEDIITSLSRMPSLFVIARNSSFTYKHRSVDVKQVGQELGVRYVLEGGVRKAANRIRVTGELIDASTGTDIWADHFDGAVEDIFDLQDKMTASVIGALMPKLEQAEIERAKRKRNENLDAYDYYLRAMMHFYQRTPKATNEAQRLFYEAIELDPEFASAYAMAAWCHVWRKINAWTMGHADEIAEGIHLARRAVALAKDNAVALARGGHAIAFLGHDLDTGVPLLDQAIHFNPNLALAWYLSGFLRAYNGEPDMAIERLKRAMRFSPLDPDFTRMKIGIGLAHLLAHRFDEASAWAKEAFREEPNYLPGAAIVAASNAHLGNMENATQAMVRLRQISPALTASNLKDLWPFRRPEDFATWSDGLRKAGLPD
jgi:TolB-like protein